MDWKKVETCSLVRRVHISACFLGTMDVQFYMPKIKKTLQTVTKEKCKNKPLWWYGGASVSIDAEAYIRILERHMLLSKLWLFSGTPFLFQHNNARPHSAQVTTAWLHWHRVCVLDWPACSPDLSPYWKRMEPHEEENQRTGTTDCRAAQVLYTPRMGKKKSICKTAKIDILVPKQLKSEIKRKGDVTQW